MDGLRRSLQNSAVFVTAPSEVTALLVQKLQPCLTNLDTVPRQVNRLISSWGQSSTIWPLPSLFVTSVWR
jgi:hypothetical protein